MTSSRWIAVSAFMLFSVNFILFSIRVIDPTWWSYDQQAYANTTAEANVLAFFYFSLYLVLFYLLLKIVLKKRGTRKNRDDLPILFLISTSTQTLLIIVAIFFNVGVAGALDNKLGSIAYIFYLFSFDGLYFAYALNECNKKRLVIATIVFSISNIVRGWAGFLVYLIIIYIIRGIVNLKVLARIVIVVVMVVPVLLYVRDFFRGGIPIDVVLDLGGKSGINLYFSIFISSLEKMLVRFDFYSSYIGLKDMPQGYLKNVCSPFAENILNKILSSVDLGSNCKPLANILPGYLYPFFEGSGTAYAIGSGFFSLPTSYLSEYLIGYLFVLIVSASIIRIFFQRVESIKFFSFLAFFLLFQGWMYQFIYIFSGYIFGLWLVDCTITPKGKSAVSLTSADRREY